MKPLPDKRTLKEAADWLVRCDRGLTAAEQDAYLDWLRRDPGHGPLLRRMDGLWGRLNRLALWRPRHSARPNADLLSARPPRPTARVVLWSAVGSVALAAALALGLFLASDARDSRKADALLTQGDGATAQGGVRPLPGVVRREPEGLVLPDGSSVRFAAGTRLEVSFGAAERRVRMGVGQAHFTVAKDPRRPFVVETSRGSVRAVGTAFDVKQEERTLAVTVTEGLVRLDAESAGAVHTGVAAGQRAVVVAGALPVVSDLSPPDVERETSWLSLHLEFIDLPLREVLAEFSRHKPHALKLADPSIGEVRIGGTFRADQAEAFASLLEKRFGFSVERTGEAIVIGRRRR